MSLSIARRCEIRLRGVSDAGRGTCSFRTEGSRQITRIFLCNLWTNVLALPGWQSSPGGLLLLKPEGPVPLHGCVNVACAFVNDRGLAVAQVTLDGIVIRITIRAVNFDGH